MTGTLGAVLAALALATGSGGDGAHAAPGDRPNIVVIVTDDQDARSMWVMQRTQQRLARWGVNFTRSFASYPLCCPSRATFLTGLYAHNHDVLSNGPPDGGIWAFDDSQTIAVALQDAGYRTGFVGKYLNGYFTVAQEDPGFRPPGWSRWFAIAKTGMFDWALNNNGSIRRFGELARHYNTDVLGRIGKRFIRSSANHEAPFFLALMTLAPHGEPGRKMRVVNPRPAPRHKKRFPRLKLPRPPSFNRHSADKPEFLHRDPISKIRRQRLRAKHQGRVRSLIAVDELVSGIIDQLRASNQLDNTYIIFTSDNGYMLGEHRLTMKTILYEESVRVPLIIRGPGLPQGIERSEVTANVDLAPTILDLAGVAPPVEPDGVALLDVIADPGAWADRSILLEKFNYTDSDAAGQAVRAPGFSYIEHDVFGETYGELYDLREESETYDPFELTNRFDDPEFTVERTALAARLNALRNCRGHGPPKGCE